ncbi:ABC transporter substrate-binding protein [Dethiosulfatarculus sandiegensis]|uniref:ABC transporter substrate-binding protein n=1 Tax=Dethiosulfatarculus sandiegensis TaxID=1429043 RepID=A0A0D2K1J3_9BACT|nr:ABC transporter substrate-binding protein [Dethiosulfatarculus sandiegensis]KIX15520.1 ABC transporter substrate-binding protein [Dethiosulfatarculus sandiegensis]
MNRLKKVLCLLAVISVAAWGMAGVALAADTVKIGVVGPRTGGAAATGTAFEEGIELALEKINAGGGLLGKKVEVVFEDTAGDPAKAASGIEKLITKDKVAMVLGESHSSAALAEIDVANRYKVPLIIAEAWHDDITKKNYPYVFRAGPCNSGVVNENIIGFVKDYKFKKVAIFAENTDWGMGIKDLAEVALKKAGIEFMTIITERKSQDHYAELNKVKKFKPDLILAFVYGFGVHYLIAQAGEVGMIPGQALLLEGAGPPSLWPQFWDTVGKYGNLELFVSRMHEKVMLTKVAKDFDQAYRKKFGKAPTDYKSRSIYDVILIAADALKRAKSTDGDKLVSALEKTNLEVSSGMVKFGTEKGSYAYHQWQPPMLIIQWQDKKQVVVYPLSGKTGDLKK